MKNQLLSIVFVDVQGYTRRTATQSREDNEKFVSEIRDFVTQHLEKHEGQLVKTMGDGFMASFISPSNAVQCGLEMQKKLESRNANVMNPDHFVRFRIGINTGEVSIDDHGDLFGDAVNIAARIESFAEPNEVFISEATYLAMNRNEFGTVDLGPQNFKNATREIRVYKISKTGLAHTNATPNKTGQAFPVNFVKKPWVIAAIVALALILAAGITIRVIKTIRRPAKQHQKALTDTPSSTPHNQQQAGIALTAEKPPEDAPELNTDVDDTNNSYAAQRQHLPPKLQERINHIEELKRQKKFPEAVQEIEKMLRQAEKAGKLPPPAAFIELGALNLQSGNIEQANEYFEKAVKAVSNNPTAISKIKQKIAGIRSKFAESSQLER
ncbi:MAG: adenylate/guanylate cyclase domain-containing protein [Candidatus Riflebacteria bacterium]|nr:adenylate/guanylate cyclase domain-containing protein [Candidatus Riflebacteria bacterium]